MNNLENFRLERLASLENVILHNIANRMWISLIKFNSRFIILSINGDIKRWLGDVHIFIIILKLMQIYLQTFLSDLCNHFVNEKSLNKVCKFFIFP